MDVQDNINLPKVLLKEDLRYVANRIIVPVIEQNIDNQIALDGNALPKNEPATLRAKARKGQGAKTLIAESKLKRDFLVSDNGPYSIKITIHPERKLIAKYLQIDGIKTKKGKKYFNFFGISTRMESSAMAYIKRRIKEIIVSGRSK
jgi:hypothetical protein